MVRGTNLSSLCLCVFRYALPAMMGFDVAGILLKWRMFDHYVSARQKRAP
jgi:hypothetical protein